MRILFMGTPEFAVASLKRLVEDGHEICGVFTQPDRPKNRGHKLAFSPVKEYALSQGLTVYQPTKMRDGTALALVQELHPELIVVAAYGRILPEDILNTRPMAPSTSTPPCCPNTGERPPSTGPSSTGSGRPASPSCIWPRSWMPGTFCMC